MEGQCVAILFSIHYLLKAEKELKRRHLPHEVVPVPRQISSDCGMALRFPEACLAEIRSALTAAGISRLGLYRDLGQGNYLEIGEENG